MKKITKIVLMLAVMILGLSMFACGGGSSNGDGSSNGYEFRIKDYIPAGVQGEEYDFAECFYADDGYEYSITAKYVEAQNGELVENELNTINGLKFVQDVYADVYVTLYAKKASDTFYSDEVVVKIRRAGSEENDLLNFDEFLYAFKPFGFRIDAITPTAFEEGTSANSYSARRLDIPAGENSDAEVYLELRRTSGNFWFNVDLSEATFSIDIKQKGRSDTAIFKFESQQANYYGNFVTVELGESKSGDGWTCDKVEGKDGWYHVEIDCAKANIERYQTDVDGVVGEAGASVKVFGLDDIAKLRIEIPYGGEGDSVIMLDNCELRNHVVTDRINVNKYAEVVAKLNEGIIFDNAVIKGYSKVDVVTDETCNSSSSIRLRQGPEGVLYPHYWIDLTSLSGDGGGIDITQRVLEFDIKLYFDQVYEVLIDFLDKGATQHISLSSGLWLGNKETPVIDTRAGFNADGFEVRPVSGKTDWYHVKLNLRKANIATEGYDLLNTGYMRIVCLLAENKPEDTVLANIANLTLKTLKGYEVIVEGNIPDAEVNKPYDFSKTFIQHAGYEYELECWYTEGSNRVDVLSDGLVVTPDKEVELHAIIKAIKDGKTYESSEITVLVRPEGYVPDNLYKVSNSAIAGNYGTVTTVTDETCNSEDALKLTQGAEGVRYPHYWVNLTTLNNGQGLDVTKRVLEFDIKLLFGEVYEINIDFLDKESTQHTSKTSQLWLGNGSSPVINDRDTFNSKGFTCVAVEGKPGWYHVTLDLSEAEIATEGFNLQNTGYLRIICSLSKDQPENATLCYLDNVELKFKKQQTV